MGTVMGLHIYAHRLAQFVFAMGMGMALAMAMAMAMGILSTPKSAKDDALKSAKDDAPKIC